MIFQEFVIFGDDLPARKTRFLENNLISPLTRSVNKVLHTPITEIKRVSGFRPFQCPFQAVFNVLFNVQSPISKTAPIHEAKTHV
jgi:hypothetical protein